MSIVTEAVDKHVPKASPSPYAKRWWTEDLSVLRKSYTRLKNQLRRRWRNREDYSPQLDTQAWVAKNVYFKAIRAQKKKHWDDFVEDNENIWQASKYLSNSAGTSSFATISRLRSPEDHLVVSNPEIATTLVNKFFPPLPQYPTPEIITSYYQLPAPSITEKDIENAIFKASPLKGPGYDRMPAVVWQKTWHTLKEFLVPLF